MKKETTIIILGTAHLGSTPGKGSPDGSFREAVYSREVIAEVKAKLMASGWRVVVDYESLEPKNEWVQARKKAGYGAEQSKELSYRVQRVNAFCQQYGKANCLYVSIHVNAAGADGKWHLAGGWCCYTSKGRTKADTLAECFYDAAITNLRSYIAYMDEGKRRGEYTEKQTPFRMDRSDGDRDLEADFYVLKHTNCAAVLTENLFQDNKNDVKWLLSDEGRHAIARLHVEAILRYVENG